MAIAWNRVRAKLAASLPDIVGSGVTVFNGPIPTGDNPPAALAIAWTPSLDNNLAGRLVQEQAQDGFSATETGSILCELSAVTGDPAIPDTFATFDAIASWIQADQTLGGTLNQGSTCTASADVVQSQTVAGAVQRLIVTITYFTRV